MSNFYCPKCKDKVLTKREEINIPLLIILGIFTGGLGAIVYLVIFYNQEQNRCVHCNSICQKVSKNPDVSRGINNLPQARNIYNFCPSCGNKLIQLDYTESNFCSYCGGKLTEGNDNSNHIKQCTICHESVNIDNNNIKCLYCGSNFHFTCVAGWLSEHNACPMCQNQFLIPKARS